MDFVAAWRDGAAPWAPALARDVYEWYTRWCGERTCRPVSEAVFLNALTRVHGLRSRRLRWIGRYGALVGPHSFLTPHDYVEMYGREASRLSSFVAAFRSATAQESALQ